jgi:uncharacterized protein YecE (DUF72 family)
MTKSTEIIVGTSGYSFEDWVGPFYPPGTRKEQMFDHYIQHFAAVELNFTYYRLPTARTMEALANKGPPGFLFWVKANQQTTHKQDRSVAAEFLAGIHPLADAGKLAGVLLQFPQSFHRTVDNRKYLAAALEDLAGPPLAVEFRHRSWDDPSTFAGLRDREVTLVVPDCPAIPDLFRIAPTLTTSTGYLRLHSRNADKWYAGEAARYDYSYGDDELREIAASWLSLEQRMDRLYGFFNNCHHAQAAQNAESFQKVLDQLAGTSEGES